jgi:hypothetical protein
MTTPRSHAWVADHLVRDPLDATEETGWTLVLQAHCLICGARTAFTTAGECGGSTQPFGHNTVDTLEEIFRESEGTSTSIPTRDIDRASGTQETQES